MFTSREPKVSIIVISHRHKLLKECIESIERQNYNNIEVLVHHTLGHPHTQMIENGKVNRLVEASVGDYIVILCEDDELEPTFVHKCVKAARKEGVDIVYTDRATIGYTVQFFESGAFTNESFDKSITSPLPGTFLIKRTAWNGVSGYTSPVYADAHITRRLCELKYTAFHLREPLFLYRLHLENRSNTDDHIVFMTQYYREYPKWAEKLSPNQAVNEWQKDAITQVLNNIYGKKEKWPKSAQL